MPFPSTTTHRIDGPLSVLEVRGDLDACEADAFEARARGALAAAPTLVVDVTHLDFLDCRGLSTLSALRREAVRAGGALRVAGAHGPVRLILDTLDRDGSLGGHRSLGEELAELSGSASAAGEGPGPARLAG